MGVMTLISHPAAQAPARSPSDPPAAIDPGPIFHVFLTDGRTLASYGETAMLGDRVIFTLVIGDGGLKTEYQLMSLPASSVDVDRTTRYRDAARASRYAATRGEADYAAITSEVSRSLEQLTKIEDRKARLAAAEEARHRLVTWSQENYRYRAKDIQVLAGLFDDVITELRVAAGQPQISMDLVAGTPEEVRDPVRRQPTLRESIEQALVAASVADVVSDRYAVLRTAAAMAASDPNAGDLAAELSRRFDDQQAQDRAVAGLRTDTLARAQAALGRGDITEADAIRADAAARAVTLAPGRDQDVQSLMSELDEMVERTRVHRAALDRYAIMRPRLLAYERELRPLLSALDAAAPVLKAIVGMRGPEFAKLERTASSLGRLDLRFAVVSTPEDLVDVHATFVSALHLAREACRRRALALAANDRTLGLEASASASGAMMLVDQARQNLVRRLYPPKVR